MTDQKIDIDAVLAEYHDVLATKDQLDSELSTVNGRKSQLEAEIRRFSEQTGLGKFSGSGISVTVSDKMRAKYEPERWTEIIRWAGDTGNTHIVQRRITDAKVEELIDSGVALPEGLTMESYKHVAFRRTK